jgi:hypothetical protein
MKRFGIVVALLLASTSAQADAISGSASGANSQVDVVTGAAAGVNITNNGQQPGEDNRTYQRIENAPSLGGLALGGGHPCAFSPATAQISVIGGGAGFGGMKVDEACMLMVMGAAGDPKAYNAAVYMIAARDFAACTAMKASGLVADCIESGGSIIRPAPRPRVSTMSAAEPTRAAYSKCELENGQIRMRVRAGQDRDLAVTQCKASLGY